MASANVPSWAADAVWYQIFPERFCNGCPESNPTAQDAGVPLDRFPNWAVRPWNRPWYAPDEWGAPGTPPPAFFDTVFHRRTGGDLLGVRQKLPYLRSLGVNALYLNPVFQAPSLHKYDAACLHHVDPTLGPDRAGDLALLAAAGESEDPSTWVWTAADRLLLDFLDEAHALGFRVILDGVFNHCGRRFFAFRDLLAKGRASPYADWFDVVRWHGDGSFDYNAWDGPNASLPNFRRDAETLAPGPLRYILDVTTRWMRPAPDGRPRRGIDGWRLDVAYCLPHPFWRAWHAHVRALCPEAYTTGEIVGPAQDYARPGEFSAVMNYEWLYPTLAFFTPHADAISAEEFARRIERLRARHDADTLLAMQNLLDSHDTGRILTLLENAAPPFESWDPYFHFARLSSNPGLSTRAPSADSLRRLRLAAFWQFTGPGAPMVYYGTEFGMSGANDPCCRQPMAWPEDGSDAGDLWRYYRALCALRAEHPALRRGSFDFLSAPSPRAIRYARHFDGETLVAVVNVSGEAVLLPEPVRPVFWSDGPHGTGDVGVLPPMSACLWKRQERG